MQIHGRGYLGASALVRTWVVLLDLCVATAAGAAVATVTLWLGVALPCPSE
jgi:hypothetical protein